LPGVARPQESARPPPAARDPGNPVRSDDDHTDAGTTFRMAPL